MSEASSRATAGGHRSYFTFRFLETAGIGPGWHCLEIGGGSGSVAACMAERVGPSGSVLVTDIDPRFMERSAYRKPAHLELRHHDIGTDPLPEQAFDLIHARLVLLHVPQRQQALDKLIAALKPRGWLVIEDFDGRVIDRTIPVSDAAAIFKRAGGALVRLMEERGLDEEWGRTLTMGLQDGTARSIFGQLVCLHPLRLMTL